MTLNEYQEAALRTAPENVQSYHDLLHGGMGVATEAGELLDVIKKHHAYGKEIDLVNLREEIGDVLWYLALLCRATGTTLDQVAYRNIDKLRVRYPQKFTTINALNRDLETERRSLESVT
jgi:NTP pyrophosphatase (non-canonical NTP hydrolase)